MSALQAFLISTGISVVIYTVLTWFMKLKELRDLRKDLNSYRFLVNRGNSTMLDEGLRFNDTDLSFVKREIESDNLVGIVRYVREDVADFYEKEDILSYSKSQTINSVDVISNYRRFKKYLFDLPTYGYYMVYKPLSEISEYFEDVDNPTQTELDYARMVLGDDKVKYYKEFNL